MGNLVAAGGENTYALSNAAALAVANGTLSRSPVRR